ncbi:UDP-N-acetylmuramoylalanyl-D-glutamyl-2,6-diaminopimelate--D-alanyl-D-alanine ligase [Pseudochrobactrum algeriensis]|uniref:UDP-N-acetylmuramoyl-tripeptide--D-alanyl-D-alanine ligase n=1 Tax=Pseudochrobactrum saccharolyticum TaxID=354352 RepID=A0A7W8ENX0_9HYPH|nr:MULTISPECIES: UDP-N-acetylmuramoylalanyl-D-glutamyl-2,6-diaminopimelate--D-alanyl-D-alanine ligase [Pseudochrobactrum]MBX8811658.1 UDP-N-acetylmuramoylalanyl-D-glutamyl-2,6-diaminopimelate--D-alanyl-D-alanine ligase [Ochrobactrum sp. MR34]KAB0537685.1 UDP-N-acetylmuramoylalanyl-D-glutamyl-2,6-diaminopimelate--D-alanyl-D-alanine ligase [Pseudochrobactrum saccharolyticum]MBB5091935.1 UDP-N-acetylmuramoyl-tripeptide--D-alanyl-D-alanine ligase [Pseudochrobactrum saccharolyticum]MDP8250224.1 UDP-
MSDLLWKSSDMVKAMEGRPVGHLPEGITGISIDSRTLRKGEAFFAIKGDVFDGHDFATAAMAAGAGLLVVTEARLPALGKLQVPMIVVDDVLAALTRLGIASRARSKAQIIAVTGSVGKTTTKEALRHVLSDCGKVHASAASFNNHWGVPLTLARMPEDTDYGVFEIGMNHHDEIRPLVKMVQPHVAVITLIAPAHLGHFANLEEIAVAKAEIFEGVLPGGYALLNRDDKRFKQLEALATAAGIEHITTFGENARSTYKLRDLVMKTDCSCITVSLGGQEAAVKISAPGRHIVQNMLAVMGAAHLVGADMTKVVLALASLQAEAGRGAQYRLRHGDGTFTLIDESYNANPASMRAALSLLETTEPQGEGIEKGRRIAVLGDMLELGKQSSKLHGDLARPIVDAHVNMLFIGGAHMSALKSAMPAEIQVEYRESVDELLPLVVKAVRPGDVVMIKSSKSIGFVKIVNALLKKYAVSEAAE